MRLTLALAVAAAAVATLAPAASATCMQIEHGGGFYTTYCSAPGGPVSATTCHRPTGVCVNH